MIAIASRRPMVGGQGYDDHLARLLDQVGAPAPATEVLELGRLLWQDPMDAAREANAPASITREPGSARVARELRARAAATSAAR